ncbi:methyltransferase domain-containing protein, partial [bacterium]|nr:methyltransferase domain-containing protein [bacterium]
MFTFFYHRKIFVLWCLALIPCINTLSNASTQKSSFSVITPDSGSVVYEREFEQQKRVYLIQDAHCQPDAQYNIARIIEQIRAFHDNVIVGIEGASGVIDVSKFSSFPDKKILKNAAGYFVEKGIISGSEYDLIVQGSSFSLVGIEQAELYRSNHQSMIDSLHIQRTAEAQFDIVCKELDRIIASRLTAEQCMFSWQWKKFYSHAVDLKEYVEYLAGNEPELLNGQYPSLQLFAHVVSAEKTIDFERVEQQRLVFLDRISNSADKETISDIFKWDIQYKLHKKTPLEYFSRLAEWMEQFQPEQSSLYEEFNAYVDLLRQSEQIDKAQLKKELFSAVEQCARKIFSNEEEYRIFDCVRNNAFASDMIALQIDPDMCPQKNNPDFFTELRQVLSLLFDAQTLGDIDWNILEEAYNCAQTFYERAHQRDQALFENLLAEMERNECSTGIIIAGGFHRSGIQSECIEQEISICVIEPAIKKISGDTQYFSLVRNYRSQIERWIARSTLALASWLASEPLVDPDVKTIRTHIFASLLTASYTRELTQEELAAVAESGEEIVFRANAYLNDWLVENALPVRLNTVEQIGNKLAITLTIGKQRLVYLFTRKGLPEDVLVPYEGLLEEGEIGTDMVQAVTDTVIERIREFAQTTRFSEGHVYSYDSAEHTLGILGIRIDDPNTELSLPILLNKYKEFIAERKTFDRISLADFYNAIQYVIAEYEPQTDSRELARSLGITLQDDTANLLDPSDLIKESFELFRRSNEGDTPVDVESMRTPWKYVLKARGIQTLVFDPQLSFEAVANTLFLLVFSSALEAGKYTLDTESGNIYLTHVIKLADNSFVARTSMAYNSIVSNFYPSYEKVVPTSVRGIPMRNGILSLQMDGAITFSTVQPVGASLGNLEEPVLRASANSLVRGEIGIRQMQKFIAEMRAAALNKGVIIRGVAFQNQNGEPQFFPDTGSFFSFYRQLINSEYIIPVQSGWAESAGLMSPEEFANYIGLNVRLSDLTGGVRLFEELNRYTSFVNKRFLDVGSQIGQNVLYAALHEPVYAVGVDFNPYNIRLAREISAYSTEYEQIPSPQNLKSVYENLLEPDGNVHGQLYFRTSIVKEHEKRTGRKIAKKPSKRIEFAVADARTLPYPDDSFDITNTLHLLEFINGASTALKEMIRVTAPGGYIQFNYAMNPLTNIELLNEAVRLLEIASGITASYEVLEQRADVGAVMGLTIIRIVDKTPVLDIDQQKELVLQHSLKSTPLPNFFDEKPYIESILAPINLEPEQVHVPESIPLAQLEQAAYLSSLQKFNILFAQELLKRTYGDAVFDGIDKVQIERGDLTLFSSDAGIIRLHLLALNDPMLIAVQMMHAVFRVRSKAIPDELFLADGISVRQVLLYKEIGLWIQTISFIRTQFSAEQLNRLITVLTGSVSRDTALEKEAYEFAHILEKTITEQLADEAVAVLVADALYSLPQYQNFMPLMRELSPEIEEGVISAEFIENTLSVAQRSSPLDMQDVQGAPYLSSVTLESVALGAAAKNPAKTIPALVAFLPRYAQLKNTAQPIPENVSYLLEEDNLRDIISLYPNAGLYILTDILKTLANDPSDPPEAPFLRDVEASALLNIMANLERQVSIGFQDAQRSLPELISLLKSVPVSAFIGSRLHAALTERNNGRAYKSITINLQDGELFEEFQRQLENQLALNNAQDDDRVVLRVNKTYPSRSDPNGNLHIDIVADKVSAIRDLSEEIILNKSFGQFDFVYGKNFLSEEKAIHGDGIYLSDEMKQYTGIGSEMFRSDAQLLMQLGAHRVPVEISSHQVRVFNMTSRHYSADVNMTEFVQLGLKEPAYRQKFYNVLFRLGFFDTSDYKELSAQTIPSGEIYDRIYAVLRNALQPNEGFLQLINRRIQEWSSVKARLEKVVSFYTAVSDNPAVVSAMPSFAEDYDKLKQMMPFEEPTAQNLNPELLIQEQTLLERLEEFENVVRVYFSNDTQGVLRSYHDNFISPPNTRTTFSRIAEYIDLLFPLIPMHGTVPNRVQSENISLVMGNILSVAQCAAGVMGNEHTVRLMESDAVLPALIQEIAKHDTAIDYKNVNAYHAWEQFVPFFRAMLNSGNPIPETIKEIFSSDNYHKMYERFPETGFYILTELVKSITADPEDRSEFPFLSALSAHDIFGLIESLGRLAKREASGDYSAVSSGMYAVKNLPARTWVGPRLNQALLKMNNGREYKEINLILSEGITTVEDTQELFEKFVQEVYAQDIQEDDIVVLRISDTTHVDGETDIAVTMIADRLRNLNTISAITRIAQGNSFGDHLFSFRTHFLPENLSIGDSPFGSIHEGDRSNGEFAISVSDELRAVGGIGSELIRNHSALMQLFGIGGVRIDSTIHGLGMMGILERQFDSDFTSNLHTDAISWDTAGFSRYKTLLFRLGLIDEDTYTDFEHHKNDVDYLQKLSAKVLDANRIGTETNLQLLQRKALELQKNIADLTFLATVYQAFSNDPAVRAAFPHLDDDFAGIKRYLEVQSIAGDTFSDSLPNIQIERRLLQESAVYFRHIDDYFYENPGGSLDTYRELIDNPPDLTLAFLQVNDFFETHFPFTNAQGRTPLEIRGENIPLAVRFVLKYAEPLSEAYSSVQVARVLTDENPIQAVSNGLHNVRLIQNLRQKITSLARLIAEETIPELIEYYFDQLIEHLGKSVADPIERMLENKGNPYETLYSNFQGALQVLSYTVIGLLVNRAEIQPVMDRIRRLNQNQFRILLQYAAENQSTFPAGVTVLLDMLESGVMESILHLKASISSSYGRIPALIALEGKIIPGEGEASSIYIDPEVFTGDTAVVYGRQLASAKKIQELLFDKGLPAEIIKGQRPGIAVDEYYVRVNGVSIGIAPYSADFSVSLENEVSIDAVQIDVSAMMPAQLPLHNEPILWQQVKEHDGIFVSGGISLEIDYIEYGLSVNLTVSEIIDGKVKGAHFYKAFISRDDIIRFYYALRSHAPNEAVETLNSYVSNKSYFGIEKTTGSFDRSDLGYQLVNQTLYHVMIGIAPQWIHTEKLTKLDEELTHMGSSDIQLAILSIDALDASVQRELEKIHYDIVSDLSNSGQLELMRQISNPANMRAVSFNNQIIGFLYEADGAVDRLALHPMVSPEAAQIIRQRLLDSESAFFPTVRAQKSSSGKIPLLTLSLSSTAVEWIVEFAEGIDVSTINSSGYINALENALRALLIQKPKKYLKQEQIQIRLVDGYWRLGSRQPTQPDGTVVIELDIDAFRDAKLLEFVLRHELEPHNETNPHAAFAS